MSAGAGSRALPQEEINTSDMMANAPSSSIFPTCGWRGRR